MDIWSMTAVIVYKSLWWIIPSIGYVAVILITEREE